MAVRDGEEDRHGEGSVDGKPPNSTDFMAEFGISPRVARDLEFLHDEERSPAGRRVATAARTGHLASRISDPEPLPP